VARADPLRLAWAYSAELLIDIKRLVEKKILMSGIKLDDIR
jgi:hypothetical protein